MKRKIEQNQTQDFHTRIVVWFLIFLFAGTSLIIIPDVNNSTLFKPYILFGISAFIISILLYRFMSRQQFEFHVNLLHVACILYMIASAVSLTRAYNITLGVNALLLQICFFTVYLASSTIAKSESNVSLLHKGVLVVLFLTFAVGSIQALQLLPSSITILGSGREVISTLGNATYFAGYIVFLIPFLLGLMLKKHNSTSLQIMLALFILTALMLLIKTESRSAWVGAFAGIALFVLLNFKSQKHRLFGIGAVLILSIIGYLVFPDIIHKRITSIFELNPQSSSPRRLYFYEGAWNAFLDSPIIGQGLGNFTVFLPQFRSADYWIYQSEDIVPHAHNEFLEILSETGILGLVAFLFVVIIFVVQTLKRANDVTNPKRALVIGYLCAIISILIDNLFSLNLRTVPVAVGFWMILGLSQTGDSGRLFHRVIQLPSFVSKVRWLPFFFLVLCFWWLIPKSLTEYKTERTVLEGNIYTWKHDEQNAKEKFIEALSFDSTHYLARYLLAASYLKQSNYKEARAHALRLVQDYPYAPKTYLIIALASFELGDTAKALEAIQKEMEIENSPQPYYYSAYFASRSGNISQECELLETMLQQNIKGKSPDFAAPGIERLAMLTNEGNRNKCLSIFQQLNITFFSDATILISLAESYYKLNEYPNAKKTIEHFHTLTVATTQLSNSINHLQSRLE
ncbi:MAG: O-antigen ligase family protein, partial [Ignavibacteriae bacterium]|nr:O-antigen ligase family protein [Ignavibacteriota bacterium]